MKKERKVKLTALTIMNQGIESLLKAVQEHEADLTPEGYYVEFCEKYQTTSDTFDKALRVAKISSVCLGLFLMMCALEGFHLLSFEPWLSILSPVFVIASIVGTISFYVMSSVLPINKRYGYAAIVLEFFQHINHEGSGYEDETTAKQFSQFRLSSEQVIEYKSQVLSIVQNKRR